jgi:uncharacterized protein
MKINVAQISEDEALTIHHVYEEGQPQLESDDSRIVGRPELDLQAMRAADKVNLIGSLKATVAYDCDRCLKPIEMAVDKSFDLSYIPPLGIGEEHELKDQDLDTSFYAGEAIDLDDLVREQVELALPMARLCRKECQGLCPECGANLNEGQCSCATREIDPRWAALEQFKTE